MTLGEALAAAARCLEESSVPSPRLTAEVLLAHGLGKDRPFLYAHQDDALGSQVASEYQSMVARRVSGEPLQYITGVQEFYGRPYRVQPSVLIPRPETEFLVEAVIDANVWASPRILDVGTGSGCIAITLALEIPGATVFGSDISLDALKTARGNVIQLGGNVALACMDTLSAWSGPFELIASNPPYVSGKDREGLQREVRDFEPGIALFGDGNPVALYQRVISEAFELLVEGGILLLEIGYSMEAEIRSLFARPWDLLPTRSDFQGIPRVVIARKS